MSHPYHVHLKNKYPEGHVESSDDRIDAYDSKGVHRVALRKNGAGQMVDKSREMGLDDEFCLAPIPKEARRWKLYKDGSCRLSEEHAERRDAAMKLADSDGRVPSIKEMEDDELQAKIAKHAEPKKELAAKPAAKA